MLKKVLIEIILLFPLSGLCALTVEAERPDSFRKNAFSAQLAAGALFSADPYNTDGIPTLNYSYTGIRLGRMLSAPSPRRAFFQGNLELLGELFYSHIFEGCGNSLAGFGLLMRYNHVRPGAGLIPYLQAGASMLYNDAYRCEDQKAIGQELEFSIQTGLGLRCFFKPDWSIDIEAVFQHISNAGLNKRNGGNNAFGGIVAITHTF